MADRTVFVDGTTSGTPGTNGAHYASLQAMVTGEVGAAPDLVAGAAILHVECSVFAGNAADTTECRIIGFTTDATHYVRVYAAAASVAGASWSDTKYRIAVANPAVAVLWVSQEYTRIEGLQIRKTASNANDQMLLQISAVGTCTVYVSGCLIRNIPTDAFRAPNIWVVDTDVTAYIWNCIGYGSPDVVSNYASGMYVEIGTAFVYSCTLIGGWVGLIVGAGASVTAKNTYAAETSTDGSAAGFVNGGTLSMTNCASSDATAAGTAPQTNIAVNTTNFTNVTPGSEDWHIPTGSALKDVGTNTSGEGAPLNFTTDIDGQARTGTWDIGADSYEVIGSDLSVSLQEAQTGGSLF